MGISKRFASEDFVTTQINLIEKEIDAVSTEIKNIDIPSNVSDLNNDSGFITRTVQNLANYYLKSETYSQDEVNAKLSAIPKFAIQPVDTLPTSDISVTTVYLLKSGEESQNLYTEYIYVNNTWEYLGAQTVDLSGYALKSDIPTKLSELTNDSGFITKNVTDLVNYYKKTEVYSKNEIDAKKYLTEHQDLSAYAKTSQIPTKVSQLTNDSKFLTAIPNEYVTESELEGKGYLTQHQDLSSYAKKSTTLAGYGITDAATKTELNKLDNEKIGQTELTSEVASALQDAKASGTFDGQSCTHSWNGTTLTITSASGSSSANLKGDKGDKGDKGVSGVYVGSGSMPSGYNIQIDPEGDADYGDLVTREEFGRLEETIVDQVNVKSFGAKGDGVTDDTDAIRLARDEAKISGKPLFFPSGTYLVHGTIQLFSYMQVIGSSDAIIKKIPAVTQNLTVAGTKGDTTVYVSDASAFTVGYDVYIGLSGWGNYSDTVGVITAIDTENNSITFKNYHRHSVDDNDGLFRDVPTTGVISQSFAIFSTFRYDDSGDEIKIENLTLDGNKQSNEPSCYVLSPIHIDPYNNNGSNVDGMGLTVRNVIVKNCHADAISMQNMGRTTIDNCTVLDAIGKGIHPGFKTTGVNISNCYVYNCGAEGIYDCNTVQGMNISNCYISDCGIGIGGLDYTSRGSTITGCVIENCGKGIQTGASTAGSVITGCAFNNCTYGIWAYVGGDSTANGCTFYNCNAGIYLQRAYRMAITGNYFIDCTKAIDSGYQTSNPDIKGSHNIISNNIIKVSDESKKTSIMDIKYMTDSMITGNILIGENASINVDETTTSGIVKNNNIVGSTTDATPDDNPDTPDIPTEDGVYQDGDTLVIKSNVTVTQDSDTLIIE